METIVTREQLQSAIRLCNSQEEHVETLQLTLSDYPEDWQPRATLWCQQAIPHLQQNAVTLDGLLEQLDEGKVVEQGIPPIPVEYNRLLALETYKEKLNNKNTQDEFKLAVSTGNAVLVDLLLQDPCVNPSDGENNAIRLASQEGHLAVVDRLLQDPRVDPSDCNNYAFRMAVIHNHIDVVKRLLQDVRVNPSVDNNQLVGIASLEILDILLQDSPSWHPYRGRVDPSDNDNYAIICASEHGCLDIVNRLLQDPRVNPADSENKAIRLASRNGHLAVVNRLLQDPRVNPAEYKSIYWATKNGHIAVVNRLLQDERVGIPYDNIPWALQIGQYDIAELLIKDSRTGPVEIADLKYRLRYYCSEIRERTILLLDKCNKG